MNVGVLLLKQNCMLPFKKTFLSYKRDNTILIKNHNLENKEVNSLSKQIPLYKPQNTIGLEVLDGIREVLESGWLTLGPKTIAFEKAFSRYVQCIYGVATNACTSALYLALAGINLKKGSSVVVPINTFVATANVVKLYGAEPLFCDVNEKGELDPRKLAAILEDNDTIECIIPVHLYGFPCDMGHITKLADKFGVKIIEDCAQAHGAKFGSKAVGSFGEAGCFSFYATKNMTTCEGGMLVTNNPEVNEHAQLLRNHGQNKTPKEKVDNWRFDVTDLGFNFRMSEIAAVIGLKQMEKIDRLTNSRLELAHKYKEELEKIPGIRMMHDPDCSGQEHGVYHLLEVTIEEEYPIKRDDLYHFLHKNGIITGVHYTPLHYFSYYQRTTNYKIGDFPCAETLYSKILSLPIFPYMTDSDFDRIITCLRYGAKK
jgi:perosamine synthetase